MLKLPKRRREALEAFVEAWAGMSSLFGFSPSTARVSALLIASPEPLALGEIAEQLAISRGNASMSLRELRAWGVARRVARPGDRRDFYEVEGDLFQQTIAIARERKRREFDPVASVAIDALATLAKGAAPEDAKRWGAVSEYLRTIDRIGHDVLGNEKAALALVSLLRSGFGAPKE